MRSCSELLGLHFIDITKATSRTNVSLLGRLHIKASLTHRGKEERGRERIVREGGRRDPQRKDTAIAAKKHSSGN